MSYRAIVLSLGAVLAMFASIARGQASGSGFFVTTDGYFVTNHHVVESAQSVVIRAPNGKFFPASVVRVDSANDLAILKAEGTFSTLPVEPSQNVRRGDKVFTLGFPKPSTQGIEPKYTEGVISSLTGSRDKPSNYQITVPLQSGNSGGPLISSRGNVVGVVASKLSVTTAMYESSASLPENVNYAVKSNYLLELIATLPNVRSGMSAVRSKPIGQMSDVAALAENAVGLVIVELPPKKEPIIAKPAVEPPQQSSPRTVPSPSARPTLPTGPLSASFPLRPIRIVVPFAPGGPTDLFARNLAKNSSQITGHSFIVDNRPGGGGGVGAEMVQSSPADGYTLLLTSENFALNPSIYPTNLYNADYGFTHVSMLQSSPLVLAVNASIQANSVNELIILAKKNPANFKYASSGNGSIGHFAGAAFSAATDINIVHVPYKGFGPALSDVLGGNAQAIFGNFQTLSPFIRSGKLRAIAVTSKRRLPDLPNTPTMEESGFLAPPIQNWLAILAPANTPRDVVNTLNQIIVKTLTAPDFKGNSLASTSEVSATFINGEIRKFRSLAATHKITTE